METAARSAFHVGSLLEKMNSTDKDFRFMAVSDLMNDFNKNSIKLDEDSEKKVVRQMIKLLEDKNGEVQNLAVRCLGTISPKVREPSCEGVVDALCDNLSSKNDEHREVSSAALSTFIKALPSGPVSTKMAIRILPKLHKVLRELSNETAAKNEILDIIGEVLLRNGATLIAHHQETENVLIDHVGSGRASVKKRAIAALSHLAVAANLALFNDIVSRLLTMLGEPRADERILVAALNAVCRASSARFAAFLPQVLPLLLKFCTKDDDELKEAAIQCLETMVVRSPKEAEPYFPLMEEVFSNALVYDPNYQYDDEEDEEMETGDDEDEEDDDEDYEDDDDVSWKVRRAAAKAIEGMMESRRHEQVQMASRFGLLLISRFKEREENVRADIFSAYSCLVKKLTASCDPEVASCVRQQTTALLKAVVKIVKGKSSKGRQLCFFLLSHLVKALPGSLESQLNPLLDGVALCLNDKNATSQMRIDALVFLEDALNTHPSELFFSRLTVLVPLLAKAVGDSFYKVSSQALVVTSLFLDALKVKENVVSTEVDILSGAAFDRLKGDVDQEVKEKAILAVGTLLQLFPLGEKATEMLRVLVDRVNNEATRLTAIKAIRMVVESDNSCCVSSLLPILLPILSDNLRKNSRALKMSSLQLVLAILEGFSASLDPASFTSTINSLVPLLSDADLQISQLCLRCLTVIATSTPDRLAPSLSPLLNALVELIKSSLLQGATLITLLDFISAVVKNPIPGRPNFECLLDQLSAPIYDVRNLPRQSFHSISATVAVVAASDADPSNAVKLASKLSEQLANPAANEAVKLFSLLTLGELGRRCPQVFQKGGVQPEDMILSAFNSSSEDLKSAAAHALGGLAVGALSHYLPFILNQMDAQPKRQYLLLHALKEVIVCETCRVPPSPQFVSQVESVWNMLMKHADCAEEGTRCVVAECLGKLCHVSPQTLLPKLKEHVQSPSLNMRAAVVTSVKFMISDEKKPIDDVLSEMMGDFLAAANDENLDVRRVALVVLNSAAHNKPELIRNRLNVLLPIVFQETNVRQDLIREVEMGPFKHSVDDGLDLRKSAFECMYTLLDSCMDKIDMGEFMTALENGLKDQHDIKLLSYLTLSKLIVLCPSAVVQRLERLCEPLKAQLNTKTKANAVKQEQDKADELKRAVMRTLLTLLKLPDGSRLHPIAELRTTVNSSQDLRPVWDSLERDANRGYGGLEATEAS